MTDVNQLVKSAPIRNGSRITSALNTGVYNTYVPIINNPTAVSGVAGQTTNGYLEHRFEAT